MSKTRMYQYQDENIIRAIVYALSSNGRSEWRGSEIVELPPQTNEEKIRMIKNLLEQHQLTRPEFQGQRDRVLSQVAIRLSQAEQITRTYRSTNENGEGIGFYYTLKHTDRLDVLEGALNQLGLSPPSNFEKAKKMKQKARELQDNYAGYLEYLEKNFDGEELSTLTDLSKRSFTYEPSLEIYIKQLELKAKNGIDQFSLKDILNDQLIASTPFVPKHLENAFIDGYAEELIKYYDINHLNKELAGAETLLCGYATDIYFQTDHFKSQNPDSTHEDYYDDDLSNEEDNSNTMELTYLMLDKLMGLGANKHLKCQNNKSTYEMLNIAGAEGLIDLDFFDWSNSGCKRLANVGQVPEFCLTTELVANIIEILNNPDWQKLRDETKSKHQFVHGLEYNGCDIVLLETVIKGLEKGFPEKFKLEITSSQGNFPIKAPTKQRFIERLNELVTEQKKRDKNE